jgi:ferrous iron transport protein A
MNLQDAYLKGSSRRDETRDLRAAGATPVILVAENETVRLAGLDGGRQFRNRLTAMGLLPGEPIRIIRNSGGGPIVLEVKGGRLAFGRGEGRKILVNRTDEPSRRVAMNVALGDLQVGDRGRVLGFGRSDRAYRTRLLTMGLVKGSEFKVTRKAPLGDPLEVEVKGYRLTLRRKESRAVEVEKIS